MSGLYEGYEDVKWFDEPNKLVSKSEVVKIETEKKPELYVVAWKQASPIRRMYGDNEMYYANDTQEVVEYLMKKATVREETVHNALEIIKLGDVIDLTRTLRQHNTDYHETDDL